MKKLLVLVSVLVIAYTSFGQCTLNMLPADVISPGHGGFYGNYKIPYLLHTPPDAVQTLAGNQGAQYKNKKYPIIIFFHGQGEQTPNFPTVFPNVTDVNTSHLTDLYATTPMSLLQNASGPGSALVGIRYSSPGGNQNTQFYYMAEQVWGGAQYTWQIYPLAAIRYIKKYMYNIVDTTRIYLSGLSLGGGAVVVAIQDSVINSQVAAAVSNCAGYYTFSGIRWWDGGTVTTHFDVLSRSGLPWWALAHRNDPVTVGCLAYGKDGCTVRPLEQVLAMNPRPVFTPKFTEYIEGAGTHYIWDWMYDPGNAALVHPLTNGENLNFQLSEQEWFLQFSNPDNGVSRRLKLNYILPLLVIPIGRRRRNKIAA